ncbi:metalloendopeptidase [Entomophthora muscae]|uniref:Metalloendopeptidase n=1 Tax=Entomophthora muscae TaxID=34485 RepID=A0ACC2U9J0_9FUNG|nr:metalloendopeptidase [Entomophthora muscae]
MFDNSPPKFLGHASFAPIEGFLLRFDVKSADLEKVCEEIIERSRTSHDAIAKLKPEECTFNNVFVALGKLEGWVGTYSRILTFPQYVSTDKGLREASSVAQQKLSAYKIQAAMREDLYGAVKAAKKNTDLHALGSEDRRLVEKLELEFKRNGLDLPKEKRDEIQAIYTRLSELSIKFSKTIADDETSIDLKEEELKGMPEDYLQGLESKKGPNGEKLYTVTMKYPDITPLLEMCTVAESRKKVEFVYGARCESNIAVLEEAIALRRKAAQLMGYKTHA